MNVRNFGLFRMDDGISIMSIDMQPSDFFAAHIVCKYTNR